MPLGARIMCIDETPVDDISERARKAGLEIVVYERNVPKPTTAIVVGLGSDDEVHRLIHIGDRVFFSRHSGFITTVEGFDYRTLEFHEITSIEHMNGCEKITEG